MMGSETAMDLALQAAAWMAADGERLVHFMGATGSSPDSLRAGLEDPQVLGSILDFILLDDQWVLQCAQAIACPPEALMGARQALPGGEQPHWT